MSRPEYLPQDPRGLIHEGYQMEIGPAEARSIFLDWALGLPDAHMTPLIETLLAAYGPLHPDHPMTAVLREGIEAEARPRKRRGRRAEV